MKLIKVSIIIIAFWSSLFGGDAYQFVDIGECILPISNKLEKIGKGLNYTEKNYMEGLDFDSLDINNTNKEELVEKLLENPIDLSIINNDEKTASIEAKAKKMLHLDKKIIISGFQAFIDNKKTNINRLVYLKNHVLFLGNYPLDELNYMLSYCKKTSREK
jgi:hypothetical protein